MGGKGRYTLGEEMLLPQGPGNPPMQSVVGAFPDGEDLQDLQAPSCPPLQFSLHLPAPAQSVCLTRPVL